MSPSLYGPLWADLRKYDLKIRGRAELKKHISFRATRRLGESPAYVTNGLKHFADEDLLVRSHFQVGTQLKTLAFSAGKPDDSLRLCEQRANRRAALMDYRIMGAIGEQAARRIIVAARRYGCGNFIGIPQSGRLGYHAADGSKSDRIDIIVRYKPGRREYPLAIEVKNESNPTYITDTVYRNGKKRSKFEKLIRQSLEAYAQPVLLVPFIDPRTRLYCTQIGIAVYEFGRQFLPWDWKDEIEEQQLIPQDILEAGYEFIHPTLYLRPDRKLPPRAPDDIAFFASDWIDVAHKRWEWMRRRGLLDAIAECLQPPRDMLEFNRLIAL